jgi:hypothetical protein
MDDVALPRVVAKRVVPGNEVLIDLAIVRSEATGTRREQEVAAILVIRRSKPQMTDSFGTEIHLPVVGVAMNLPRLMDEAKNARIYHPEERLERHQQNQPSETCRQDRVTLKTVVGSGFRHGTSAGDRPSGGIPHRHH